MLSHHNIFTILVETTNLLVRTRTYSSRFILIPLIVNDVLSFRAILGTYVGTHIRIYLP